MSSHESPATLRRASCSRIGTLRLIQLACAAGQRLDRVRDIESIVTLVEAPEQAAYEDEVIDLTVESSDGGYGGQGFGLLAAGEKWADVESD